MNPDKTKHDFLDIKGDAQLGGKLKVKLIDDYILSPGKKHKIINIEGTQIGKFKQYNEGDLVNAKNHAGSKLFISYQGGDGNDVILYTKTSSNRSQSVHPDHQDGAFNIAVTASDPI